MTSLESLVPSLESLVPSLEVCQQLKEAGFPQDTVFSWIETVAGKFVTTYTSWSDGYISRVAALTAEEVLKELPVLIRIGENCAGLQSWVSTSSDFSFYVGWQCNHPHGEKEDPWYGANKLSEAAAAAYLWWRKEKP